MSERQGQAITSYLMMIPLLVVPLVAIFGVPKFDFLNVSNAEGDEPELDLVLGENTQLESELPEFPSDTLTSAPVFKESATEQPSEPQTNQQWADPFSSPQKGPTTTERPASGEGFVDPFAKNTPPETAAETDPFAAEQVAYTRPASPETSVETAALTTTARQPESIVKWREAVARLNELGVQKFQLSQTEEPFVFQFECDLSHPDNPRITHRFHAEAGEPLQAVAKVIQQVETWSAQSNIR